jgi:hypothetical protein
MKQEIKKVGRPKVNIDIKELQKLCTLNCTMPEIAHFFDIPLRTLEDRFKNDPEVKTAIEKGRAQGKLSVRRKQLQIMDETNNATMAIWLGKQLLGQRDKHDIVTEDKGETKLSEALQVVQEMARNKNK